MVTNPGLHSIPGYLISLADLIIAPPPHGGKDALWYDYVAAGSLQMTMDAATALQV